ncbi:unnamed protein product [Ceutorhynchus assimilis]|uniref:Uncharacterized protein n=1 Tax=Ceutorhynchus assimilis TaxID=467358 RepID=A0A9N9MHI9_9CUCU|nr:unnamed protein product [Ceutorhynchus assimilis]
MAIGLFKLSKTQRNTLSIIFYVLNIIEVLFGLSITGTSIYVCLAISPMILTEKAEIDFVFVVYIIFGVNITMTWLIGLKICQKCTNQAHKKSTRSLLLLWYCAGTNMIVTLLIITSMSRKANKHIIKSMKNSLQGGMESYLSDSESKETIDKIQYNLECCGYESYKDWYRIEWMNDKIIENKARQVEELRLDNTKFTLPVVPWSCCKVNFPLQCLHDPLQQRIYTNLWVDEPETVTNSLNTEGCLKKMRSPFGKIIESFTLIISAITILHVITILVSRILYTSCRNAILLYDQEGVAPGWLFGRGDCGYARGKTLTEIMGITNEILEQRIIDEKRKEKVAKEVKTKSKKSSKTDQSRHTESSKTTTLFDGFKKFGKKSKRASANVAEEVLLETNKE